MTSGPQPLWALVPPTARARYVRRLAQAVLDEVDDLANVLALEAGIPRTEALLAELFPSVGGLHGLAEEGPGTLRDRRLGRAPVLRAGRRTLLFQAPAGTVGIRAGAASPWAEPVLETAAALLAGNAVVLETAVPAVGVRLQATVVRAGFPEELVRIGDPSGCEVEVECGRRGPKGTMLVLDGAPLDRTIPGALWAAFARAGRGPASLGRVVVVPSAADALLRGLEAAARRLRIGDPREPQTEVGPLRSAELTAEVDGLVKEAVAAGAVLLCGGPRSVAGTAYYAPAVLRAVPPDARLLREPVPGPVLAVVEARSEAEAIALARESVGAVSVWTGDRPHGERIARALPAEVTWVNEHGFASPAAPVRLARYTVTRQLASQPRRLRSARWLPYDAALVRASATAARVMHGRESERVSVLTSGGPNLVRVAARLAREQFGR